MNKTSCPECGGTKDRRSERCRSCSDRHIAEFGREKSRKLDYDIVVTLYERQKSTRKVAAALKCSRRAVSLALRSQGIDISLPVYLITEAGRECSRCKEFKAWDCFSASESSKSGANRHHSWCRPCINDHARKAKNYLKCLGWTKEMWEVVLYIQEEQCANSECNNPATQADHDHQTGEPRAALCMGCNIALGQLGEDLDRIKGLTQYIEQCENARRWLS